MKKHNLSTGRNFGYGKQMDYAAKQALNDRYGEIGKFATKASHLARFKQFSKWCKENGIRDARYIGIEEVREFCNELTVSVVLKEKSVSYAQNQISSINVVLSALRGDKKLTISPSQAVGERTHIREVTPLSLDRDSYTKALSCLNSAEAKVAVSLARELGLRLREVALFRPKEAMSQYLKHGAIDIQRGVKGGRTATRLITPTQRQLQTIAKAEQVLSGKNSLVDNAGSFTKWRSSFYKEYYQSGAYAHIGKFHDNRAAFACELYKQITGKDAPVVAGRRLVSKSIDKTAREFCSQVLGHHRIDVVASYIGSSR